MANTLARRTESKAIREQMQAIRNGMPGDADAARARMRQLTDWKYHVRQRPWAVVAAAAVAGYLLVPARREQRVEQHADGRIDPNQSANGRTVAAGSVMGSLARTLITLALRSGVSIATKHFSEAISASRSGQRSDAERYANGREPHESETYRRRQT